MRLGYIFSNHFFVCFLVEFCGTAPDLTNGLVSKLDESTLLIRCSIYYTREGPEHVFCLGNGKWSHQPNCLGIICVPISLYLRKKLLT